ncbi:MAG: hypothetical protein JWM57_882 [Phycisphaerales bacterium]|nr:hypothetical protein [Phycisphaerales bacterium]
MSESPPPIPSKSPPGPSDASFGKFMLGLVFGGGAAWVSAIGGVVFLFGMYGEDAQQPAMAYIVPFIGPIVIIAIGLLLTRRPRFKPFGLGLVASVPLTALVMFIICGH